MRSFVRRDSKSGKQASPNRHHGFAHGLAPSLAGARFNLGVAFALRGRFDDALECYRPAEALGSYDRAIALAPRDEKAHFNRGAVLVELRRFEDSLASFERAIALKPDYAGAFGGRGVALWNLGCLDEGLDCLERALAIEPGDSMTWSNRAMILLDLDRAGDALESCERAIALDPGNGDAHYHRGNAMRALHRFPEAVESYEMAIAIQPRHAFARWNLADTLLLCGDFARGWSEYESRWKPEASAMIRRSFREPVWLGEPSLQGRTILLHGELGLGDTLQFCRYAREIARMGGKVVMEVQAPLVTLLRSLDGVAQVLPRGGALPAFDFHCPMLSLPLAFRAGLSGVPVAVPYLRSDPERVSAWKKRMGEPKRPRVGLAWCGSAGLRNDKRSMAFAQALTLLADDVDWFSLQKEVRTNERALLAERADIRRCESELTDFSETAALVELMDLVVTVDTSIAHLAGALGKPVWILLPHTPHDWRWLLGRGDSQWYPTARLFRQASPGEWGGLVREVSAELRRWLSRRP